jgi:hypothetical protein
MVPKGFGFFITVLRNYCLFLDAYGVLGTHVSVFISHTYKKIFT